MLSCPDAGNGPVDLVVRPVDRHAATDVSIGAYPRPPFVSVGSGHTTSLTLPGRPTHDFSLTGLTVTGHTVAGETDTYQVAGTVGDLPSDVDGLDLAVTGAGIAAQQADPRCHPATVDGAEVVHCSGPADPSGLLAHADLVAGRQPRRHRDGAARRPLRRPGAGPDLRRRHGHRLPRHQPDAHHPGRRAEPRRRRQLRRPGDPRRRPRRPAGRGPHAGRRRHLRREPARLHPDSPTPGCAARTRWTATSRSAWSPTTPRTPPTSPSPRPRAATSSSSAPATSHDRRCGRPTTSRSAG